MKELTETICVLGEVREIVYLYPEYIDYKAKAFKRLMERFAYRGSAVLKKKQRTKLLITEETEYFVMLTFTDHPHSTHDISRQHDTRLPFLKCNSNNSL